MRLLRLSIRNFRVIRRVDLQLPDQVIGIIGPNGSGKSSLIEAIAWVLYGNRAARSSKEEIRSVYAETGGTCEVILEFELNGESYRVERRLIGARERAEVVLYRSNMTSSVGIVETEKHIAELLGLDWRGFLTSFLARQQELNALADLAPSQRRDHLAGMLGIDRLDLALRRVKDERRLLQQSAASFELQIGHSANLIKSLSDLAEHAKQLGRQQDNSAGAYAAAKQVWQTIEQEYRDYQARQAACSQLTAKREAVRSTCRYLGEQLAKSSMRQTELIKSRQELETLADQLKGFERLKTEREELEKAESRQTRLKELESRLQSLDKERTEVEETLADGRSRMDTTLRKLGELPANSSEELKTLSPQLEQARNRWIDSRAEVGTNDSALEQIRKQMAAIEEVGPEAVCERCRRPFGNDLPGIRSHLDHELSELLATGVKLGRAMSESRKQGEQLKVRCDELQLLIQRRKELELIGEPLKREVAGLESRLQPLSEQVTGLTRQIEEVGPVTVDPARLDELRRQVNRLEREQSQALILEGELKALPEIEKNIADNRDQLARAESEAAELQRQLDELGFDEETMVRISKELAERREAFDKAREVHLAFVKELELTQREIKAKEEEVGRMAEIAARLEECRTDQFYSEKLVSLLDEFRKYTISRIRPRLAELSSQLISEMSGHRYGLVELDEDYNLHIMDGGKYFGIDRFSGGEKDLVSLGLRLAISQALTESAGLDRSFVILDEVFGSQDSNRRDLIFQALANLKGHFPQVILVTHLDELKHKVETLIELLPQPGGWSEVRLNGEVA